MFERPRVPHSRAGFLAAFLAGCLAGFPGGFSGGFLRILLLAVPAAVLTAGCADTGPADGVDAAAGGDHVLRRDSAGLSVVEIPRRVLDALPVRVLEAQPAVRIGAADGPEEELLGSVSDATLLTSDRLAIADRQLRRILIFSTTGAFQRAIGGEGQGPGEFRNVNRLAVLDDTLYVPDMGRIQRFTTAGDYVDGRPLFGGIGTQSALDIHRPGRFTSPHAYRLTPDGFPRGVDEGHGPHRTVWVVGRYDTLAGAQLDTLPGADTWYVRLSAEEMAAARQAAVPLGMVGSVLHHPAAPEVRVAFLRDRPLVAWTGRGELRVHDPDYTLARIIRLDLPPIDVNTDQERLPEWFAAREHPSNRPIYWRAWKVLDPPTAPARFHELRTGRADHIWMAVGPEPGPDPDGPLRTRWLRLRPDGTPVEWAITPADGILELGPDGVLRLETDHLGVQRVALHRWGAS
ncbi:MAG: 6-bladed beta-propeller [Gemmatimonadota bacterium]